MDTAVSPARPRRAGRRFTAPRPAVLRPVAPSAAAPRSGASHPAAPRLAALRPVALRPAAPRPAVSRSRLLGWGLIAAGTALVPWMYTLAVQLPATAQVSNWSAAWVGLDAMLAAGLLSTGVLLARRDARHGLTAAATGALLLMDAWFDVLTSADGGARATALLLAVGAELPLAALCGVLAVRALRPREAAATDGRMDVR
ncbi:hypothetical protein [Actinomadura hibisca]|uniref:hypothetical protein n=1 Tax=Actinomadura hibisca TaxID=68565 RepID=UPI000A607222|nr:hypothetical protein [Actinomadura hibisca]